MPTLSPPCRRPHAEVASLTGSAEGPVWAQALPASALRTGCGPRARWALTSQFLASHSDQMEETEFDAPPGHPHLRRLWHSPEQVQVRHFTC